MKTILLMRHAKAEAPAPGQEDFDRRLSTRGREDAERMGKTLAKLGAVPDAIVASPAARAKETAEAVARAMSFEGKIRLERALYATSGDAWIAALRSVPVSAGSALVVAHSPGIAEAAAILCGASPRTFDVPTAGLIALDGAIEHWRDVFSGGASLRWLLRPKLIGRL